MSASAAPLGRPGGDLSARSQAQLAQNVLDVHFGCALADHERGRNFPIAPALCEQLGNFALTVSERIGRIRAKAVRRRDDA